MKCVWCKKSICFCYEDTTLPTKSTLSSSVTEFPGLTQERSSRIVENPDFVRKFREENNQRLSTQSPRVLSSVRTQATRQETEPYQSFEDYIKGRDTLVDCKTCSKRTSSFTSSNYSSWQPSPNKTQQVRTIKHL